jgi:SAM-dependent methyltransferase
VPRGQTAWRGPRAKMARCWPSATSTAEPLDGDVPAYERFAAFYDEVMDDPAPRAARVLEAIARYRPGAASLLELGCGTGSILQRLTGVPTLVGLDLSPEMLAVAGTKAPGAELLEGDLTSFSLGRTFDVIICVFDTLNHLLTFDAWLSAFDSVAAHLAPGGLFVFDINTIGELGRLGEDPPAVYDFRRGVAVVDVAFAHDGEDSGLSSWDIRVFEDRGGGSYTLHRERIGELGVRLAVVRAEVERRFDLLELTDEEGRPAGDDSVKAHFVAGHRPLSAAVGSRQGHQDRESSPAPATGTRH